jgi:hypothetical protein
VCNPVLSLKVASESSKSHKISSRTIFLAMNKTQTLANKTCSYNLIGHDGTG